MESEQDKQQSAEPQAGAPNTAPATAPAGGSVPAPTSTNSSSRRVFIGLGVGAVVIVGAALAIQRTPKGPGVAGDTVSADITLITSDRADVECSAANGIGAFRCGFSDESTAWKGDEQNKLKPYYTTDRHIYLIPGLFLEPALQTRFKSEPPEKPRDQLKRFTAHCNLKILGKVGGVKVRWLATGAWSNPEEVDAATVVDCKVDG